MIRMSLNESDEICADSGLTSVDRDPGACVAKAVDFEKDVSATSTGS